MVRRLAFFFVLGLVQTGYTQFNSGPRYSYLLYSDQQLLPKRLLASKSPSTNFTNKPNLSILNFSTPWLGLAPASTNRQVNAPFWIGSIRTQKVGRFGTDHFFDMSGNLRNSSTFWNVRSKSKKGFKLYFSSR